MKQLIDRCQKVFENEYLSSKTNLVYDYRTSLDAEIISIKGHELSAVNELDKTERVKPVTEKLEVSKNKLSYTFEPHSVNVIVFN